MSIDKLDFRIEIEEMYLNICKVQVNPGVIYGHNEILKSTNAKYPFTNTDVKLLAIPAGNTSFSFDQLFNTLRPNKVVIGFVSGKAVSGDNKLNPFNFKHYDLSEISLLVDGIPVGGNAMKMNFNPSSVLHHWLVLIVCFKRVERTCKIPEMVLTERIIVLGIRYMLLTLNQNSKDYIISHS